MKPFIKILNHSIDLASHPEAKYRFITSEQLPPEAQFPIAVVQTPGSVDLFCQVLQVAIFESQDFVPI